MSQEQVIRGKKVDADVVDLATDDEGLDTAIVGFFDVAFPRRKESDPETLGEKARLRASERAVTPPPVLR